MGIRYTKDEYDNEKDPPVESKEWPWSVPRSVMKRRYGELAGEMPPTEMPHYRKADPDKHRSMSECNPVPIYLEECKKLGKAPSKEFVTTLQKLWEMFLLRNGFTSREPGEEG